MAFVGQGSYLAFVGRGGDAQQFDTPGADKTAVKFGALEIALAVDRAVREAWQDIRSGAIDKKDEIMKNFFDRYVTQEHLPRSEQLTIDQITVEEVKKSIKTARNTAAGADDLYPIDLKLLPDEALAFIVVVMQHA